MFASWVLKPLAAVSAIAFSTLGVFSRKYQKARFYFHLTLYISTLGALSLWGVVVSLLAPLVGQRLNINYYVARSFYHTCKPLIGIKFDVEGEEHLTNLLKGDKGKGQCAVLIGNHQSAMDILYLGRIFPKRASIMAKQELKWSPLLGQYPVALSGAVFVDRKNRHDAVKALEKAGDDMKKKGISLWIFPEGTRSSSAESNLLPFKKGAFHLAVQAQVPIVPVVCENYHRLFDGRTRMDSGHLRIRVLPPLSTSGLTADDVTSLAETTREKMLEALREISSASSTRRIEPLASIDDGETPRAELPHPFDAAAAATRREKRSDNDREESGEKGKIGSELSLVDSRGGETTEDEMDEDAVLLKHPKAA